MDFHKQRREEDDKIHRAYLDRALAEKRAFEEKNNIIKRCEDCKFCVQVLAFESEDFFYCHHEQSLIKNMVSKKFDEYHRCLKFRQGLAGCSPKAIFFEAKNEGQKC